MKPKLSILIPTLPERLGSLNKLLSSLYKQITIECLYSEVEVIVCRATGTIGHKRNKLLNAATGDYLCFIDDDDDVVYNYLISLFDGINKGVDCCSLLGEITIDKGKPEIFEHSIKYKAYKTTWNYVKYERYPNHLNCIRSEIAKQFKFPEINHGEDTDWATQIFKSGLIKTEHDIPFVIYYYNYISKK